ncbi:LuxR family transcriptional regulator [Pseudonocardiaceae bacterium YIM PH 21723]|nr:LuxR family transcriptional regulator [Pseudonocardiaceae bacterium YIM PH 21723]
METIVEAGAILGSAAGVEEKAAEILMVIRRFIPWDAAVLSSMTGTGEPSWRIAGHGVSERAAAGFDQSSVENVAQFDYSARNGGAHTLDSMPGSWELPLIKDVLVPEGFNQVIGSTVQTRDRRITGMINLCFADARDVRGEHLLLINRMRLMLGGLTDPWRAPLRAVGSYSGRRAAIVLPDGDTRAVPESGAGEWLVPHGALSREIAALAAIRELPAFFWWQDPDARFHRVVTARVPGAIVAVETQPPLPCGLTAREVEVLRLLVRGHTDEQIAYRLVLSLASVAGNVRTIFAKLRVRGLAGAVTKAAAMGLVPHG